MCVWEVRWVEWMGFIQNIYPFFFITPCSVYRTITWGPASCYFIGSGGWDRKTAYILITLCFTLWLYINCLTTRQRLQLLNSRLILYVPVSAWLCSMLPFYILYSIVAYTHKTLFYAEWEALFWMCQTATRERRVKFFLALNCIFTQMQ